MSNTKEIARRVFLKVAAAQGIYQLSPEGLDIAMACPFVDATSIGLNIALACEIAARAEDVVESGGTYTADVRTTKFPVRKGPVARVEDILERGGYAAVLEEIKSFPRVAHYFKKYAKDHYGDTLEKFIAGEMPSKPRQENLVKKYVVESYKRVLEELPPLENLIRDPDKIARGLLRDLDVNFEDNQLQVYLTTPVRSDDPRRIKVLLDGEVFYEVDPFAMDVKSLNPEDSFPTERFLHTKGETTFRKTFLGSQDINEIAIKLQELNASLNHSDEGVRTEAQEWVSSDQGMAYLYRYVVGDKSTASREVKAAARGFIKRIYKNHENANFGKRDIQEAKRFFGKDTKMLLQKCWNKSPLKQAFGQFKVSDRMLDIMIRVVCDRLQPKYLAQDRFDRLNPAILTDVITVIMIHTALSSMGVTNRPNFKQLLKL